MPENAPASATSEPKKAKAAKAPSPSVAATTTDAAAQATPDKTTPDARGKTAKEAKNTLGATARMKKQAKSTGKSRATPMTYYWLKDYIRGFVSHKNFPDSLAIVFALASVSLAFPFLPPTVIVPLLIITFAISMLHPMAGLLAMFAETLPMLIYQTPLLAWMFTLFMSVSLFIGYKYYRTITFAYMLIMLPMSSLGAFLEIPAFLLSILVLGFKRGAIVAMVAVLLVIVFSGLTGIQNTGPIVFNATAAHSLIAAQPATQFLVPSKPPAYLTDFGTAWGTAWSTFASFTVGSDLWYGFSSAAYVFGYDAPINIMQMVLWVVVVFAVSSYAIKSRSGFRGAESSMFGAIIPAAYVALSFLTNSPIGIIPIASFVSTPLVLLYLEFNNISVVKALEVMKQDFLGKFGEAFEDLSTGAKETLDDVANYDETKKELREALIAPIEHREIAGAYGVKPARGILLFGPPGTGKTLMMRALANDLRAGFFYVKTSSILSPYAGEAAQAVSRVFATAKKHPPAILFFDEIDSITGSRDLGGESEQGRQLLSTLLGEMDGFQKTEGVVIVGTTNVPHILDPSILRPGRFDKVIYMPLPDASGRAKIFQYYLKKLPISQDLDYAKLGEISNRFSGADIKNVSDEVARQIADVAVTRARVLEINMQDIVRVIKQTKPSTSLAQIDEYNMFKMDYERRAHPEKLDLKETTTTLDDVVGLKEAKKALYEAVEVPILHPELIKKFDISSTKGILLFGPPGTGKTMLMRAVANELGDVHIVTVSGADIAKGGLERAVLTIKQVFDRAKENAPAILFIDEIDAIVASRENATQFNVQVTGEFLEELDGMKDATGVVLVGTSNRPDALDPAILRAGRFDKLIFIPPPEKEDRQRIFEQNLKKAPTSDDIDYAKLADMTVGYTGADIATVCKQAKLGALEKTLAAGQEAKIAQADIEKVLQKVRPSAPSIVIGRYMTFLSRFGSR